MKKIALAFLSLIASFQLVALPAMAQTTNPNPLDELKKTGLDTNAAPLPVIIGNIIRVFMGVLGIIMVLLILYAGFLWMTAGGDEGKVETAKALIKNSVIGLILILLAYAITTFVISSLTKAAQG